MFFYVLKTGPVAVALFATLCLADDVPQPACTAQNYGRMWPDAANDNPKMLIKLARCGGLQVCSRPAMRYKWVALTVRVDQLPGAKKKAAAPAGCETPPANEIADSKPAAGN